MTVNIKESERLFYKDLHNWLFAGDCRSMYELPDECVQMVVTSPPYWGLRKYSGEQDLIWGGDKDCEHEWGAISFNPVNKKNPNRGPNSCVGSPTKEANEVVRDRQPVGNTCSLCGAWRGSFGLEPKPELYVEHTVEILREIRRVLRKDGVVFYNIGDSYSGGGRGFGYGGKQDTNKGCEDMPKSIVPEGLKPKDLCLIPFRVAIAAQTDGWWVRSVIIWNKPNPMPESVTDRPTESHEYILMLTKSARYYWDQEAVREQSISTSFGADQQDTSITHGIGGGNSGINEAKRRAREAGTFGSRNLRSVWSFPTQPFPEAHFAVFPEKLPELCIKAATPEVGCCSKCGAPWERITENTPMKIRRTDWGDMAGNRTASSGTMLEPNKTKTIGWQPTCKCNADKVASIVLDPFSGAGTTLWEAKKLNRRAVGYDLSVEYCKLNLERNRQQVLGMV